MIVFILILAFALRLMSLNQSLWLDEATSALTTRMNLTDFFGKFMPGDFHPPLYYLALRMWAGVFGTSEIALRSLSILFGIGTIYLVYLIGKELINKETGLVASVLIATSGLHIYYSQEARMYTMSTFLVTLVVYFFLRLLRSYDTHEKKLQKGRVVWFLFALTLGLIFLTDYLPFLIIPVFFIFGIFSKKDFSWFKKLLMSHIILVVFVLLWFPTFIKQLTSGIIVTTTSPSWVNILGKFSLKDILLIPVKFGIGRVGFNNKFVYAFAVGFIFLIFGFLFFKSLFLIKKIKLIYLWLIIPILISLVISIKIPVLNYFRFLFVLPAFYLIVASGLSTIKPKWRSLFLVLVIGINLITSYIYLTNQKFQREDWRGAVSFLESMRVHDSVVIFPANSQMEVYRYYAPNALIYGPDAIKKGYSELWLVRYAQPISDPTDTTRVKIEDLGYMKTKEFDFNGVVVWRYTGYNNKK